MKDLLRRVNRSVLRLETTTMDLLTLIHMDQETTTITTTTSCVVCL